MKKEINTEPKLIFKEHEDSINFKNSLGKIGLFKQAEKNERFYVGDQWFGAKVGNDRPLVRHNIIKRIADYKQAVIGASPVTVQYSADGVPNTVELQNNYDELRAGIARGEINEFSGLSEKDNVNLVMGALSDYFKVTAERLKFNSIKEQALRNAYISGTAIVYTYWDSDIKTGLYADETQTTPIKGDIVCEVLDIENVDFGDPNIDDVQKQPYIIISQRKSVADLKREAKRNKRPKEEIENIVADSEYETTSSQYSKEPNESEKTTVLTKLWKEYDDNGDFVIKAIRVTKNAIIRDEWDLGVRLYPIAKFNWERRRNCVYGESEVTYLIPNQIAINRMLTANVWAVMIMGMPITLVNGEVVTEPITNNPAQVINVTGTPDEIVNAVRYVVPPNFSPNFENNIASLINNTLSMSGANQAALGDVRPDNTSAIIVLREAATMPLQTFQNRFYQFCEDIARIWAEFWVMLYGKRSIKIEDSQGIWYLPFDGEKYKDLVISVKVDVGASTLWSEAQNIQTLDNLLQSQVIDVLQYLERMPKGIIPDVTGLIKELRLKKEQAEQMAQMQAMQQQAMSPDAIIGQLSPEEQQVFAQLPPEAQQELLAKAGV